jgi:protein O-mannosyl-transferase
MTGSIRPGRGRSLTRLTQNECMPKRRPPSQQRQPLATVKPTSPLLDWCRRHPAAVFAAVSLCWVALLYGRAITGPFVYDDVLAIQQNPDLASCHALGKYFRASVPLSEEYRGYAGSFYRPVFWLSLFLDRSVWGLNPAGFHITNLLLHWVNGILVLLLLRRLQIGWVVGTATSLLWLGLPISSEVVAWISGRPASLVVFFFLLSAMAALSWAAHRKPILLAAYAVALAAAMLSNEWAIVALPLTLLLMIMPSGRAGSAPITIAAIGAALIGVVFVARSAAGAHLPIGSLEILPVGLSLLKYIQWMILPLGLSIERSSETPPSVFSVASVSALAIAALLIAATFLIRKRAPNVAAGLAWMFIAIAPFCGLVFIYQGMAERYTYLASAGLVFAVVSGVWLLPPRARPLAACALIVWAIWGAWRVRTRVGDYQDETVIFRRSLETSPKSAVLLYNLGVASAETGDLGTAAEYYRRALAINPRYASVLINFGSLLHRQGRDAKAGALLRQAIQLAPRSPEAWVDLGNVHLQQGSLAEARQDFEKALALDPNNLAATTNLGAALLSAGDFAGAERHYRRAIELGPTSAAGYCGLGTVLVRKGQTAAALDAFGQAVSAEPGYAESYFDLGMIYEQTGERELAAQMYAKTLQLQPGHPKAWARLDGLKAKP